ncbi:MAG: hypothetical protein ACXVOI_11885, partial [Tumebacillaceae bacterium]
MRGLARNVQVTGAVLLVVGYLQDVLITLQAMSFKRSSEGMWQVNVEPGTVAKHWSLIAIFMILLGMLAFIAGYLGKKLTRRPPRDEMRRSRMTTRDMLNAFGWVALLFFG